MSSHPKLHEPVAPDDIRLQQMISAANGGPRGAGEWGKHRVEQLLSPALVFLGFIACWYVFSYLVLDPGRRFLLPPPHQVIARGFLDTRFLSEMLHGLAVTTRVALMGLGISIALGMSFAIMMSGARWIERSFFPYAVVLQTVPILAMVPLIGFWFGFTFPSRVIVSFLISLFPIITNTLFGLISVERSLHDIFTLNDASRWNRFRKLMLPSAIPAIFTGFRISAGLSVIGAIVGDFFFRQGEAGIGILIDRYRANLQSEQMLAAIFWSSLLGLASFYFFAWVGNRLTRNWHASARAEM